MQHDSQHYTHSLEILGHSPLFAGMDDTLLEDMLEIFHYESWNRGGSAISPKQATDHLYLIIRGRAKVSIYKPDTGREHILFLIGPGDGFDLISLLNDEWNNAVVTALEDMEVLFTTVQQARDWLNQHPEFYRAFMPYLGRQMRGLADQVADLSLYNSEARLARLILRNLVHDKSPQEARHINGLSQEALASMIGSGREVVTRHMHKWKQKKIITGQRGNWSVLDTQALLEKAE